MVALIKHCERLVGLPAKRQTVVDPSNTVFAFMCLIGRKFKGLQIQDDIKHRLASSLPRFLSPFLAVIVPKANI